MFILNTKRLNIYAPFTAPDGTRYANLTDPAVREKLGVVELSDPTPPEDYSDETYYRTEQDTKPYVVYTKKPDEQLEQLRVSKVKAAIAQLEAGQARSLREATLTGDKKRLQELEDAIAALRATL